MASGRSVAQGCVLASGLGLLVAAVLTMQSLAWHGAENWAALMAALFGSWIVIVQLVLAAVTIYVLRKNTEPSRKMLRWWACVIPVITVVVVLLGAR